MRRDGSALKHKTHARYTNFELLRIIAMFMIVMYHIVYHCVEGQLKDSSSIFNEPVFFKRLLILNTIETFGIIGNAIFILISGYFLANRKPERINMAKISKKLLFQLGFAAVVLVLVPPVLHRWKPEMYVVMNSITRFNTMSWFVGYYFVVVLCGAVFLNRFLGKLGAKKYAAFLLTLFAFVQFKYSGALAESLMKGLRTVLTGIFLYSLGGYIRRYNPFKNVRLYVLLLLILCVYGLVWLSGYNVTETNIEAYMLEESTKPFVQSIPGYKNYSIVIMILSVCMFELFRRMYLPENRGISFLGKATFMVYLIHDNSTFYKLWGLRNWVETLEEGALLFIMNLLKWSAYTFGAGVLVYVLYVGTMAALKRNRRLFIKESVPEDETG